MSFKIKKLFIDATNINKEMIKTSLSTIAKKCAYPNAEVCFYIDETYDDKVLKLIKYAKELNFYTIIKTKDYYFSKQELNHLIENKIDEIQFCTKNLFNIGDTSANNLFFKVFSYMEQAIKIVDSRAIVTLNCEVDNDNIIYVSDTWMNFSQSKLNKINFVPTLDLSVENYKYLYNYVKESKTYNIYTKCELVCHHYLGNSMENAYVYNKNKDIECATIFENGDVGLYPESAKDFVYGNLNEKNFLTIWENEFQNVRNRTLSEKCQSCTYKFSCQGDSVLSFDFQSQTPTFCYKDNFDKYYTIEDLNAYLDKEKEQCNVYEFSSANKENVRNIVILPEAFEDVKAYLHFGKKHPFSMYEQEMSLIGFSIEDTYVIKYIVPNNMPNRRRNLGYIDNDFYKTALYDAHILNECFYLSDDKNDIKNGDFKVLGFLHSHPMTKDVKYHTGDINLHKNLFNKLGEYVGIIADPCSKNFIAYYGKDCVQGNLIILERK